MTSISGVGGREGQPEIPAAEEAECRAISGGAGSVLQEKVGLLIIYLQIEQNIFDREPALRIRDILIRIRGSVPLIN